MLPAFLFAQEPTKLRATVSAAGASKAISYQGNNYLIQSSIAQRSTVGHSSVFVWDTRTP